MSEANKSFDIETISPIIKKIKGEIPWKTVSAKFDETYKELSKTVSIKGFRRGKVPKSLLKRMFKKHIEKDLVNELVREVSVEAIQNSGEEVRAVNTPNEWVITTEPLEDNKPLAYAVEVEVVPEIEVKDYRDIEAKRLVVDVKDEDVEHQLGHLQQSHIKEVPVEDGKVEAGHILWFDIMGKIEGEAVDFENQKITISEDTEVEEDNIPQRIANSHKGMDIKDIPEDTEITLEFNDKSQKYSGKSGKFFVEFKGIVKKSVPELNDDFAKSLGESETLEDLKNKIREDLAKSNKQRSDMLVEKEIIDEIIKRNDFEVGNGLVTSQAEMKVDQTLMQLGITDTSQFGGEYKKSLIESYKDNAVKDIKQNLILDAIAKQEKFEVSEEDIEKTFNEISEQTGESVERIKAEYAKDNKMATIEYKILLSKTLDFLKEVSKITEEKVSEFPDPRKLDESEEDPKE